MNDIRELYQQVIIDHGRRPRNFGHLRAATHTQLGHNPLCGDQLTLYLKLQDNKISEAMFEGRGCAISMASASLMTQAIIGMTTLEVEDLGKLGILSGVSAYPARVKCATLAWHTLHAALQNESKTVSTE